MSIPSLKNPVLISGPLVSRRTDDVDVDVDDDNKVGNGREGKESKDRVRVVHECNNVELQYWEVTQGRRTSNVATLESSHFSEAIQDAAMSLMVSVRKVEACNVHASIHELSEVLFAPRSRTDGADDLGATFSGFRRFLHHVECDESSRQHGHFRCVGNHSGSWLLLVTSSTRITMHW